MYKVVPNRASYGIKTSAYMLRGAILSFRGEYEVNCGTFMQ